MQRPALVHLKECRKQCHSWAKIITSEICSSYIDEFGRGSNEPRFFYVVRFVLCDGARTYFAVLMFAGVRSGMDMSKYEQLNLPEHKIKEGNRRTWPLI